MGVHTFFQFHLTNVPWVEILISSFCYFNKQLCFIFTDDPQLHVVLALYSDSIPHVNQKGSLL